MNKKLIIQTVIIVACFLISGIVLYKGLFSSNSTLPATIPGGSLDVASGDEAVLPHGTKLDFDVFKRQNFQYGILEYPKLNPQNEIGVDVNNLIKIESTKP